MTDLSAGPRMAVDMDRRELTDLVRDAVNIISAGDVPQAQQQAKRLEARGFVANWGVDRKDMTPEEVIRWFGGQIMDIVATEAWYAMNSVINSLDRFVPADF